MTRPRLLDLFCGAGGAAMGYYRAGFDVVGVDIRPQPHYPFEFHQADALAYPLEGYHAIHASPPCQFASEANPLWERVKVPNLIPPIAARLRAAGCPYVVENVENARWHLATPLMLCGTMFGLRVWRHRWFEISPISLLSPACCQHIGHPVTVQPGSNARRTQARWPVSVEREAMDIDWMTREELREAIPPAYTAFIGRALLAHLAAAVAA